MFPANILAEVTLRMQALGIILEGTHNIHVPMQELGEVRMGVGVFQRGRIRHGMIFMNNQPFFHVLVLRPAPDLLGTLHLGKLQTNTMACYSRAPLQ